MLQREFFNACQVCKKPIERKYQRCWVHRSATVPYSEERLPEPSMRRRPANHRGKRTESISTLN